MTKSRLHQFLGASGKFATKKEALAAIEAGDIAIDGKVVKSPHFFFDPKKSRVQYKGASLLRTSNKEYYVMNKPIGYLCAKLSEQEKHLGKKSIYDVILSSVDSEVAGALFCVGRLDEDTSGLIIITNDGKFGSSVTDPLSDVPKTYRVLTNTTLKPMTVQHLQTGVRIILDDHKEDTAYTTKPCKVVVDAKNPSVASITITEGKKRQVRRMFTALGIDVLELERIAIGSLELGDLKEGELRKVEASVIKDKALH